MKKKCKVVMLSTNGKASLLWLGPHNILSVTKTFKAIDAGFIANQHLYILSLEPTKQGELCYSSTQNQIGINGDSWEDTNMRIIATTDPELHKDGVAKISESFILKYIEMYNKGNKIEDVMVEYIMEKDRRILLNPDFVYDVLNKDMYEYKLKLRPDNTIITTKVQDSFSREEVIKLFEKFETDRNQFYPEDAATILPLKDWISENL